MRAVRVAKEAGTRDPWLCKGASWLKFHLEKVLAGPVTARRGRQDAKNRGGGSPPAG